MELFEKLDSQSDIIIELQKNFNIENIIIGNLFFGSIIPAVFVQFKELDGLNNNWKDFNSLLTAEYLIKMDNEFSKWNSYVFYIAKNQVAKSLKYEIENNKFSTRKIVIEIENFLFNEDSIKAIISEHIVNDNINYNIQKKDIGEFVKNDVISTSFTDLIDGTEKKVEESTLEEVLKKIETYINHED